jgi:hypothetical protein
VAKPTRISKVDNAHLRRALYMPALVAVQHEPVTANTDFVAEKFYAVAAETR